MKSLKEIYKIFKLDKEPLYEKDFNFKESNYKTFYLGDDKYFYSLDFFDKHYPEYIKSLKEDNDNQSIDFKTDNNDSDFVKNKEEFIYDDVLFSLKIEGIHTSKEHSKFISNNTSQNELTNADINDDFKKTIKASLFLYSQKKLTEESLFKTYKILSPSGESEEDKDLIESWIKKDQKYRDISVGVFNLEGKKFLEGIDYEKIPSAINNLLLLINNSRSEFKSVIEAVAITHCLFEAIHPYLDGNGRMGRLLNNWIYINKAPNHYWFALSSELLYFNRDKYKESINNSQRTKLLDYFVAFFIELDRRSFIVTKVIELIKKKSLRKPTKNKIDFIKLLLFLDIDEKWISYKDISKHSNTSKQNVFLHLNNLFNENILERKEVKGTHLYKMNVSHLFEFK